MSTPIPIQDDAQWRVVVAELRELSVTARALELRLSSEGGMQHKELIAQLALFVTMAALVDLLWNSTETAPGEAAGITLEIAEEEERLIARQKVQDALSTGGDLVKRARAAFVANGQPS